MVCAVQTLRHYAHCSVDAEIGTVHIQLFRERLSENCARDNPER